MLRCLFLTNFECYKVISFVQTDTKSSDVFKEMTLLKRDFLVLGCGNAVSPYKECLHAKTSYEEWFRNGRVDHVMQTKRLAQGWTLDRVIPHNFVTQIKCAVEIWQGEATS